MDKTRNKIFVGCLALLLVMVAGYALFSQSLNITGTAKAQGDFSLAITCQPGIPDNLKGIKTFEIENGYYDDSCIVNGDSLNYKVSLKWPGARRYFIINVKNTGSMNAILDYEETGLTSKYCTDSNRNGEYELDECEERNESLPPALSLALEVEPDLSMPIAIENRDGKVENFDDYWSSLSEEEQGKLLSDAGDFIIKPGVSVYYEVITGLNKNISNTDGYFDLWVNFNYKFFYRQPIVE